MLDSHQRQPVSLSRNQSFTAAGQEPNNFTRNAPLRISAGAPGQRFRASGRQHYNGTSQTSKNYMNIPPSASGGPEHLNIPSAPLDSPCNSEPGVIHSSSSDTLKNRLLELESERNRLQNEIQSLSQHCSWAIRNRNDSYVEVERLKNEIQHLRMVKHQEMQQVVERLASKEHEYALVMSERDTVLKELEDLQDQLNDSEKEVEKLREENAKLLKLNEERPDLEDLVREKNEEVDSLRLRCEWALSERENLSEEVKRLRSLNEQLMRERDEANLRLNKSKQQIAPCSSSSSSSQRNRSRDSAIDSADQQEPVLSQHNSDSDENGRFLGVLKEELPKHTPKSLRRPHLACDDIQLKQINLFCETLPLLGDDFSDETVVERCLGMQLVENGGPLVQTIEPSSSAALAGIEISDRLLEIDGRNIRNVTAKQALEILGKSGPKIQMTIARSLQTQFPSPSSLQMSRSNSLKKQQPNQQQNRPHYVYIQRENQRSDDLLLIGGNLSGIFVEKSNFPKISPGDQILEINGVNLRGATLENAYVELNRPSEEMVLLAQQMDSLKLDSTMRKLRQQNGSGDGFYVRCLVDWQPFGLVVNPDASDAPFYLTLQKDAVIYIDNTMPENVVASFWSAWVLDDLGQPVRRGLVPSKLRFEDEPSLLQRATSHSANNLALQQNSTTPRSSARKLQNFIRRARLSSSAILGKKPTEQQQTNQCENPMTQSACSWNDAVYQRVEPLDRNHLRPVVLISPIADALIYRLCCHLPHKFEPLSTEIAYGCSQSYSTSFAPSSLSYFVANDISRSLHAGEMSDSIQFRSQCGQMESFSLSQVQQISRQNRHCLLDVGSEAIEQLQSRKVYPIVIFIRHQSASQLKRVKGFDDLLVPRKMTAKNCQDLFDECGRFEEECRHLISTVFTVDNKRENSVEAIASQIASLVEMEQAKQQWVPSSEPL